MITPGPDQEGAGRPDALDWMHEKGSSAQSGSLNSMSNRLWSAFSATGRPATLHQIMPVSHVRWRSRSAAGP